VILQGNWNKIKYHKRFIYLENPKRFVVDCPRVFFEGCLTVHLLHEIIWNAKLMQQGNFIHIFLARYVSGTYTPHQEHWMLSCSIWFSAPSFWMGGGLESRCVGRVCTVWMVQSHSTIRTVHTTHAAALKTTTHPKTRCRKPYAATQHPMLLMRGVCTRDISS